MMKGSNTIVTGRITDLKIIVDPVDGYVNEPVGQTQFNNAEEAEFEIIKPNIPLTDEKKNKTYRHVKRSEKKNANNHPRTVHRRLES